MDRSLSGYSPWGLKESEITEVTEHTHTQEPIYDISETQSVQAYSDQQLPDV